MEHEHAPEKLYELDDAIISTWTAWSPCCKELRLLCGEREAPSSIKIDFRVPNESISPVCKKKTNNLEKPSPSTFT